MSRAGKVTALILVSQMETSIEQDASDLNGERQEWLVEPPVSTPRTARSWQQEESLMTGKRQMSCSSMRRAVMTQGAEG